MEKYEVVIIGAGPAGLAAAKILGENNKKVLVLEKNKVIGPKVCGGGLTTKDFNIGIQKDLVDITFSQVILHTPLTKDFIKAEKPFVTTIPREKLGEFMKDEALAAGAEIKVKMEVKIITGNKVITIDGQEFEFDNLIGADGSSSIVRRYLKLPVEKKLLAFQYKIPQRLKNMEYFFNAKLFNTGYAWIFPFKNFTSVGCGAGSQYNVEELQKNFHRLLKKLSIDVSGLKLEGWIINSDYRGWQFGNIYLAGDAAGFASGLTGEGIYAAIVSGQEIARKIINPEYETPKIQEILSTKNRHEKYLNHLDKNLILSQIAFTFGGILFKTGWFDKKLIKLFG